MHNPFMMPIEEQKDREFLSFARMVVVVGLFGLILGGFIYAAKWGW